MMWEGKPSKEHTSEYHVNATLKLLFKFTVMGRFSESERQLLGREPGLGVVFRRTLSPLG